MQEALIKFSRSLEKRRHDRRRANRGRRVRTCSGERRRRESNGDKYTSWVKMYPMHVRKEENIYTDSNDVLLDSVPRLGSCEGTGGSH